MKSLKKLLSSVVVLAGMPLFPLASCAQEQQNDAPPKPAAKVLLPIWAGDEQEPNQPIEAMQPDDRPLTGFQQLTVGTPPERHSYWVPGVSYTNTIQSNAFAQAGGSGWYSTSYLVGNLSLSQNWSRSQLSMNYSGGGTLSSSSAIGNGQFHQFGAFQTFNWRRLQLTFLDQFSYLPASQFGFGAGTPLAVPGVGGPLAPNTPGLQNGFTPNQSIFATLGPRYSNSSGGQITYLLSSKNSLTLGGVFSILRFTESGNIESNDANLTAGYNLQVSRSDTLGLSYRFSAYHYLNSPQAIGDHLAQAVYGKRITGRLALQLSGGVEATNYRVPQGLGTKTQYIAPSALANLTYAFPTGGVSLNYNHGVNNGGGFLLGATSDQIIGSGTRKLTRMWSGNVSVGYARNKSIGGATGAQTLVFNSVYAGAGLQRPLSRTTDFTLNYNANVQTSNTAACGAANCGASFTTHVITVGLNWRAQPFVLH
ncbi:MAG TPA: hypothetical protein VJN92_18310 [Candidatus Acidoferrum sp.]|nr:hypothetical protein [Candidatus Acidoferrum sp.]